MNKWKKKIRRRADYYDCSWDKEVEEHRRLGLPMRCSRAYRREGFVDGAEWMLEKVLHLLRQKKYKCDKLIRQCETMEEKSAPLFVASIYSHVIKELTE